MEQILTRLLAEMSVRRDKMDANQENIDDGQEEMKAQVASLSFRINANQREMAAKIYA
jgi:hypothetical protein